MNLVTPKLNFLIISQLEYNKNSDNKGLEYKKDHIKHNLF